MKHNPHKRVKGMENGVLSGLAFFKEKTGILLEESTKTCPETVIACVVWKEEKSPSKNKGRFSKRLTQQLFMSGFADKIHPPSSML
jgi:hypothetical protein